RERLAERAERCPSGELRIEATASQDGAVCRVERRVDGVLRALACDAEYPLHVRCQPDPAGVRIAVGHLEQRDPDRFVRGHAERQTGCDGRALMLERRTACAVPDAIRYGT